eukprot:TRINITY_DN10393_c0_g1_i1.p1 TRINITY_DN10393_c0_g1~~TRINITY_DN10393_c0_g1_i1.p1  ORF type:complete len:53 (+),score=2.11 TRINITY_DN10393_c0_g1_i1:72-230(+)
MFSVKCRRIFVAFQICSMLNRISASILDIFTSKFCDYTSLWHFVCHVCVNMT